jgi:acyl-CoA oxidase
MARLFIRGRDYGPHAFVVPIRDMASHLPLPGVRVGDIGPKFGYNGVDNGFLSFNHVRVPREHMLMRFAKARFLSCLHLLPAPCLSVMACQHLARNTYG